MGIFLSVTDRSSRQEEFCNKGVLRNFAKFTGKHLCQSLFFDKVAGLRPGFLNLLWLLKFAEKFENLDIISFSFQVVAL